MKNMMKSGKSVRSKFLYKWFITQELTLGFSFNSYKSKSNIYTLNLYEYMRW